MVTKLQKKREVGMARYNGGFVYMLRSLREKEYYSDNRMVHLVIELIYIANYKESKVCLDTGLHTLLRGQVLTSTTELAATLRLPQTTVCRLLDKLEKYEFLTKEVTKRGTIITICNYDQYQKSETETDLDSDSQTTKDRLRTDLTPTKDRLRNEELRIKKEEERKKEEINSNSFSDDASASEHPVVQVMIEPKKPRTKKAPLEKSDGSKVWDAYAEAYEFRWGVPPVRNAAMNTICKKIVDRIGAEDAPHVAQFYVSHDNSFYVAKMHQLPLLLTNVEQLRTEWATGRQMTRQVANQIDSRTANHSAAEQYLKSRGIS